MGQAVKPAQLCILYDLFCLRCLEKSVSARDILPPKQTLRLVQSSIVNVNLMNAILGFACVVAADSSVY